MVRFVRLCFGMLVPSFAGGKVSFSRISLCVSNSATGVLLIDHPGDVGQRARPRHFGFPLLPSSESEIVDAVSQPEGPFEGVCGKL